MLLFKLLKIGCQFLKVVFVNKNIDGGKKMAQDNIYCSKALCDWLIFAAQTVLKR